MKADVDAAVAKAVEEAKVQFEAQAAAAAGNLAASVEPQVEEKTGTITGRVWFLSAPDGSIPANRVKLLPDGAQVTILGTETNELGDWYKVQYEGIDGYVVSSHVIAD